MYIDLHIHSKDCSDGKMTMREIFENASRIGLKFISITDHDAVECQASAEALAIEYGISYLPGIELNISFSHSKYMNGKAVSLDLLGYQYDIENNQILEKVKALKNYRKTRAEKILLKINEELNKKNVEPFSEKDMEKIEENVDGAFGRPHIADYMVKKGLVSSRQEAFDKYLVKCNVPKMKVSLEEASELLRGAGGKAVLAHPNDPNGTSMVPFSKSLIEQIAIIKEKMLPYLDGIECWHSRHDKNTTSAYLSFARQEGLLVTGGSDCHQQPLKMGSVNIPEYVAKQFGVELG
jgi:predicted metal-dependent phosphoesterase TrpH